MKYWIKKMAAAIIFLCIFIIPISSFASAPIYLNGDLNFVRIDSHYDYAYYLDRSSMYVKEYNPPEYIIVTNICVVPDAAIGSTTISSVNTYEFYYDISKKNNWKMYYSTPSSDSWHYIKPHYTYANNGVVLPAGEMAFYIEYIMPFYGKQHPGLFPDSFYGRV